MTRRLVSSGSDFEEQVGYSRAVVDGDWVFVAGTTGYDYDTMAITGDVVGQAEQAMANVVAALAEAGARMDDVVRVRYILPDRDDFEPCWPVLRRHFGTARPAATMIVADLATPEMRIEVEVTARIRDHATAADDRERRAPGSRDLAAIAAGRRGELTGRTAIVTGAASGIGRALAVEIHRRGGDLVLADHEPVGLARTADDTGGRAVRLDVASPEYGDELAEVAGTPTLLCLNAGIIGSTADGPVWEASHDEWRRVMDVNLGGVVTGLRTFVPRMLATGRRHHVLVTASLAGLATWPGGGAYAASKHAVITVAEQAALALADTPISVTVLCPALVRSGMSEVGDDPADVAARALDAVAAEEFAVVPGDWADAVVQRAHRLVAGQQPTTPAPAPPDPAPRA